MEMNGANILVTGGCGFIGGHLVEKLVNEGTNITVLDIVLDPRSIFAQSSLRKKVSLQLVDIRDREKVLKILKKCEPSYVIHLAAEPVVEKAYQYPYSAFETNIMGTVNILDAVRMLKKVKGIIVASSDKAYGKTNKAYREDTPLRGNHPYDVSKSCEDLIAQAYHKTYDLPIVITRFGNVYGEGDLHFGRIIPDICKAVIDKNLLLLRSNGKFVRDYLYVKDAADGYIFLLKSIDKTKGNAYNFSSSENFSVIELIEKIENVIGVKVPYKILNNAKNEIPYQHLNDSKIRKLGWKNRYSIKTTIPTILDWYSDIL